MAAGEEGRIPVETPAPDFWPSRPKRKMLMTPAVAGIGGMIAFLVVMSFAALLPTATFDPPASPDWAPLSDSALAGRGTFMANGCLYCHSGFSRPQDVATGQYFLYPKVSAPGDYAGPSFVPNLLGSERTGPDLKQQAGAHPDDWQFAHFFNPRFVMPLSVMPQFNFLSDREVEQLVSFVQTRSGKSGLVRTVAQGWAKDFMLGAMGLPAPPRGFRGADAAPTKPKRADEIVPGTGLPREAIAQLAQTERGYWLADDPLQVTEQNLMRGRYQFRERCAGCHGELGNGKGPARSFLRPPPFNFAPPKKNEKGPHTSDGLWYYRILVGHPGTAMEDFGQRLSVDDIWRVVLFLRTIPRGGLSAPQVDVSMYRQWTPSPKLLAYIRSVGGIERDADYQRPETASAPDDIFLRAAKWVLPGVAFGQKLPFEVDGVPVTLLSARAQIRGRTLALLGHAYDEAAARGDQMPPREQVLDFSRVEPDWFGPG